MGSSISTKKRPSNGVTCYLGTCYRILAMNHKYIERFEKQGRRPRRVSEIGTCTTHLSECPRAGVSVAWHSYVLRTRESRHEMKKTSVLGPVNKMARHGKSLSIFTATYLAPSATTKEMRGNARLKHRKRGRILHSQSLILQFGREGAGGLW